MILFPEGRPTTPETFDEYLASGGYDGLSRARSLDSASLIGEIERAGLTGRGGAGFPVARKWRIAAETESDERFLVCNGGEDEPGSFKDRLLIEHRPHLLLEGALIAARAIGAGRICFYLNEHYDEALRRIQEAVHEARVAGLVESTTEVAFQAAPSVYVAGEDSAALEVIEGRSAMPRQKPPYPAASGILGRPTVVNNIETIANVGPILKNGADWFLGFGTPARHGTMLFCLGPEVNRPGLYELSFGRTIRDLFQGCGGGLRSGEPLKAILPGPSSSFLPACALDLPLDPEALVAAGSSIGCGVFRFFSTSESIVEAVHELARFFAKESCGQCPACRMETHTLVTLMDRLKQGQAEAALLSQFEKIIAFNRGKGFCSLIHMPGPPMLSALKEFPAEFEALLKR